MAILQDSDTVRKILIDTVGLLCRNSLQFDKDLKVQGLLGVTLDGDKVVLIQFDEFFSRSNKVSSQQEKQPCTVKPVSTKKTQLMSNADEQNIPLHLEAMSSPTSDRYEYSQQHISSSQNQEPKGNLNYTSRNNQDCEFVQLGSPFSLHSSSDIAGSSDPEDHTTLLSMSLPITVNSKTRGQTFRRGRGRPRLSSVNMTERRQRVSPPEHTRTVDLNCPSADKLTIKIEDTSPDSVEQISLGRISCSNDDQHADECSGQSGDCVDDEADVKPLSFDGDPSQQQQYAEDSEGHTEHFPAFDEFRDFPTELYQQASLIMRKVHPCTYDGCNKRFTHRRHLLRHQTEKHGRQPRLRVGGRYHPWFPLQYATGIEAGSLEDFQSFDDSGNIPVPVEDINDDDVASGARAKNNSGAHKKQTPLPVPVSVVNDFEHCVGRSGP